MAEYAIMPYQDYVDIADAVREKTGTEEAIVSGDMAEMIGGISVGGGNPNYVEMIEGTLGNILSGDSRSNNEKKALLALLVNNNASATLRFTVTESSHPDVLDCDYALTVSPISDTSNVIFDSIIYDDLSKSTSVSLGYAYMRIRANGANIGKCTNSEFWTVDDVGAEIHSGISADTPTTLTIIHHPLPE